MDVRGDVEPGDEPGARPVDLTGIELQEQMGGTVTAESVLGHGTTVSVTLPAVTDVRRPSSPPAPNTLRSGGGLSLPAAAFRRSGLSPFG